jgi:hypothetical protein
MSHPAHRIDEQSSHCRRIAEDFPGNRRPDVGDPDHCRPAAFDLFDVTKLSLSNFNVSIIIET